MGERTLVRCLKALGVLYRLPSSLHALYHPIHLPLVYLGCYLNLTPQLLESRCLTRQSAYLGLHDEPEALDGMQVG